MCRFVLLRSLYSQLASIMALDKYAVNSAGRSFFVDCGRVLSTTQDIKSKMSTFSNQA